MKVFVTEKVKAVRAESSVVSSVIFEPESETQTYDTSVEPPVAYAGGQKGLETYVFNDVRMIIYNPNAESPDIVTYSLALADGTIKRFPADKYSITAIGG